MFGIVRAPAAPSWDHHREQGVRESWVVDPVARQIAVHDFVSDTRREFTADESLRSAVLPQLHFKVARAFASPRG